jgi:SnoaL-like protein
VRCPSPRAPTGERVRLLNGALSRRDFDAFEGFVAPDAVFRGPSIGTFERAAAIRGFAEDVMRSYEEFDAEAEEIIDLASQREVKRRCGPSARSSLKSRLTGNGSSGLDGLRNCASC